MGRLIDADKLNTEFAEILTALKGGMGKESITREEFAEAIKILKGCVDEQPTAYNVDKVVEELACNSRFIDDINEHNVKCISCVIGQKTAIEIVKKGGVEHESLR